MFVFCIVNVDHGHTKAKRSKESLRVRFKDGMCAELCLKLWFESV